MDARTHARRVDDLLAAEHPDAHCALDHTNPWELLVATVLSARTTDERVNGVTPELFGRWPEAAALAGASTDELEEVLRPLGFFRSKAAHLHRLAVALADTPPGTTPRTLEELVELPGVGRKTANVVLGNAYGVPGITVDTHVGRLARRLGMTDRTDPVGAERDLMALWDEDRWVMFCHRLIFHGRRVCTSRAPACDRCLLAPLCPSAGQV